MTIGLIGIFGWFALNAFAQNCEGDCLNGKGIFYNKDGSKKYEGEYKEGKYDGKGTLYYFGKKFYEGEYQDGRAHGKGIEYYYDGQKKYEGEYKEGAWDGEGILYHSDGKKWQEGLFKQGEYEGPKPTED